MQKTILIILIIIIAVIGGYFLLNREYQSSPTPAPGLTPEEMEGIDEMMEGEGTGIFREITVIGTEFAFSPSEIEFKAGEGVNIVFENKGNVNHNLVIEGLKVGTRTIKGGQTDIVEFIAPASGTYTIFCSIPGHRAAGMEGVLIIE